MRLKNSGYGGRRARFLFPIYILLLVSLACSMPSLSSYIPTAVPTVALNLPTSVETDTVSLPSQTPSAAPPASNPGTDQVQVQVKAPPGNLPPALAEVQPPVGSELNAHETLTLFFNQPMQRDSVESALQIQPGVAVNLSWVNDATLSFTPDALPGPGEKVSISLSTTAKAVNGQSLPQPWQAVYQTPPPVVVTSQLPEPGSSNVIPTSAVAVSFNHPVAAFNAGKSDAPPAVSIDPLVEGRGEWINTSTYIFYPQPGLAGGVTYTVHLNADLLSQSGLTLAENTPTEWTFTTALPQILSIQPSAGMPLMLDGPIQLTFNQPMNRASLEGNFSLINSAGNPVAGKFAWNDAGTKVSFSPLNLLERSSTYTLLILSSVSGVGGTPLGADQAIRLSTAPVLQVTQSDPGWNQVLDVRDGYAGLTVRFSAPLKENQDFASLVNFDPPLTDPSYNVSQDGYQLFVSGYFKPSTRFSMAINTDLRDRWDGMLDKTFYLDFSTSAASPALVIPVMQFGAPAVFVPQSESELPAQVTNITRININRGSLPLADFLDAAQNPQGLQGWQSREQASWSKLIYTTPNTKEAYGMPLTASGQPLDTGLYFYQVVPTQLTGQALNDLYLQASPALLVVSSIQMTVKLSTRQAFVWAVQVGSNQPRVGELVTFYDGSMNVLGNCATDENGTCSAEISARAELWQPVFAVTGQPGDGDFSLGASNWSQGVAAWDFGLPYSDQMNRPNVYLYTDRPIYRPGQTVYFKAVARSQYNARYQLPEQKDLSFNVLGFDPALPDGRVIASIDMQLSTQENNPDQAFGTASAAFTLPDDLAPGTYYISPPDQPFTGISFEVAEYRKPEIDLQVLFSGADHLAGDNLAVGVNARYFFGAPAGSLNLHWALYSGVEPVSLPGNLAAGRLDLSWLQGPSASLATSSPGAFIMEGDAQTDPQGKLTVLLDGKELQSKLLSGDTQRLTFEVTAEDESGLPVSARGTTLLHPSQVVIGIRSEDWMGTAGKDLTYYIRTADWSGVPVPNQYLKAHFRKVTWSQKTNAYGIVTLDPQYSDAGSTDFKTSENGEARLSFLPGDPGTYVLEVSQEGGGEAVSEQMLWVGGPGNTAWPNPQAQHLLLQKDADHYQPGQQAVILIPNPFGPPAQALITVERGKVMRSQVVTISELSFLFNLALTDDDAPNIYVGVMLLGSENNRPSFRSGYIELTVQPVQEVFQVKIAASPQQVGPGDNLDLTLQASDADGNPVQAEFSVALIDKAVLALANPNAPGIVEAFYGRQPLGVNTGSSLVVYSGRAFMPPPGRGGGGSMPVTPVRGQFKDTAYWNGAIVTGSDGTAQVTVKLPDNLTTWVVDARGITADSRVGEGKLEVVTSRPLLVRPVTPLFVTAGDHLALGAVVQNNTADDLSVTVSMQASGFQLDDPSQASQQVDLPAGSRQKVVWWGQVSLDVSELDAVFQAQAGSLSDAARPEGGSVPVLAYTSPQTFTTSGVLDLAGEQLETINLPRSFKPSGGQLTVELMPGLSSTFFNVLASMERYPSDLTEQIASHLLADTAGSQALADALSPDPQKLQTLQAAVTAGVAHLARTQNADGGWGWMQSQPSDPWVTSYVLYALLQAEQSGQPVSSTLVDSARAYVSGNLAAPSANAAPWQLDQLAFEMLALQDAGQDGLRLDALYNLRAMLSPWGQASLALALEFGNHADPRWLTLLSDLQSTALRSSSGAYWEGGSGGSWGQSSPLLNTAFAAFALSALTPDSQVLPDAARYLALKQPSMGRYGSSYETAWVLSSLWGIMRQQGDVKAAYDYSALLNATVLLNGKAGGLPAGQAVVPLSSLAQNEPNALQIERGAGDGRLYYRASLQVNQPVDGAPALEQGMSISREYILTGQDCASQACPATLSVDLTQPAPLEVRLTLTVPQDMSSVVVEDYFPAGTEMLHPRLKTTQQGVPDSQSAPVLENSLFNPADPFSEGWGWWYFTSPQVFADHIRWTAQDLPAGTYLLTYRLVPYLPGEFRILPACAWEYYFPEVQAESVGEVLVIK